MGSRGMEMRRLQKKLIPVNLIVCILCLVAAISMFFTPFLSIDLGKIVSDESITNMMKDKIKEMFDVSDDSSESGDQASVNGYALATARVKPVADDVDGAIGSAGQEVASSAMDLVMKNLGKVMTTVIDQVFNDIKGNDIVLVLSPKSVTEMAFSQSPATQLMGLIINDETGLVRKIVDSLVGSIKNIGNNREFTSGIESAMIDAFAGIVKEQLPEEFREVIDEEKLKKALNDLNDVESADAAAEIFENLLNDPENGTLLSMSDEEKEVVTDKVKELYNKTVENTKDEETGADNFTVEAMVCVMASESMEEAGLGEGALDNYIKNLLGVSDDDGNGDNGGENNETPTRARVRLTEEQVGDPSAPAEGEGTQGGNEGEQTTDKPAKKAPTTYGQLFSSLVSDDSEVEITTTINAFANEKLAGVITQMDEMDAQFHLFKIIAGVWMFFIGLWLILFLFSFFHMFARNKRFMTWYVKIFCPWPAIIFWLLPFLAKNYLANIMGIFGVTISENILSIINIVAGGISSMLWISGLCYLLLWAVMLLWAFPIKHKIRKLKKAAKMERYRY